MTIHDISSALRPTASLFELGVIRYFGQYDIAKEGLVSGWAEPEFNHTWNNGSESNLYASIMGRPEPCVMTFDGHPYISGNCPTQKIELYINGYRMGAWCLDEGRDVSMSVQVEPEQLLCRDDLMIAKCTWLLPNSVRPKDVDGGSDARKLGFCFRSLSFTR